MTLDVDVRDLLDQPGSSRAVHVHQAVEGLRTELAQVPEDRPVQIDLVMESVVEGVLASGPVAGTMQLTCARCLRPFDTSFQVEVRELFSPEPADDDLEYPVREGFVDLTPMIRDNVVTAMPYAPLCRPDCQGLCPRCGGDRNLGECSCPPPVDERWSALADVDFGLNEGEE